MDTGVFVTSEARCTGCGACASLVPEVFALRGSTVAIVRQPLDDDERDRCRAALLLCPVQAIGAGEARVNAAGPGEARVNAAGPGEAA